MKEKYDNYMALQRKPDFNKIWFQHAYNLIEKSRCFSQGSIILDIGCGNGEFSELMHKCLKVKPAGIDMSDYYVEKMHEAGYEAHAANLENEKLPFESESIDGAVCLAVIEHIFDADNILSEINRVLKPGAKLVISTPNVMDLHKRLLYMFKGIPPWKEGHHVRFFTRKRIELYLLMNGFDIIGSNHYYPKQKGLTIKINPLFVSEFCYLAEKTTLPVKVAENYWEDLRGLPPEQRLSLENRVQHINSLGLLNDINRDRILRILRPE
ncbi:class I SAM-dependent methyltransferase [Chloroflexota bacterium]